MFQRSTTRPAWCITESACRSWNGCRASALFECAPRAAKKAGCRSATWPTSQRSTSFSGWRNNSSRSPAQATATTEEQVKVHVLPGRKTGYLYLLNEKQKVDLLQRQTVDRNAPVAQLKDDKRKTPTTTAPMTIQSKSDNAARRLSARIGGWCATRKTAWAGCWAELFTWTCRKRLRSILKASELWLPFRSMRSQTATRKCLSTWCCSRKQRRHAL